MSETSAVVEKSLRSVFVGNIPYEATEEKLRDIFSQVGPVLSFKLMYDRESGKPKGYGFCEYKDQETALSAMRNLNGFEIGGRPLRVDNACTEKSRMEMQSLMMGPVVESPFGPDVDPEKAPEAISNAVASLPPEQMYELMRQMKLCVRNNPSEARTMLMNNPQLAYALLQAQVVMRIIDPKIAVQILYGSRDPVEPILPSSGVGNTLPSTTSPLTSTAPVINGTGSGVPPPPSQPQGAPPIPSNMPTHYPPPQNVGPPPPVAPPVVPPSMGPRMGVPGSAPMTGPPPPGGQFPGPQPQNRPPHPVPPPSRIPFSGGDYDLRQMGSNAPRAPVSQAPPPPPPSSDQDMRMPPSMGGPPLPSSLPHENFPSENGRFGRDFDQRERFREGGNPPPREREQRDSYARDSRENRDRDIRPLRDPRERDKDYRSNPPMEGGRDPRGRNFQPQDKDFRSIPPNQGGSNSSSQAPRPSQLTGSAAGAPPSGNLPPGLAGQDQEKASLIMQVLQLSDEQIRMLPPEQQASIMQLKEQIQRSSH
ncbi:Cleavage stimulation factor subunit 2 [Armadillidium nasatum]|uniref:Cleavage stimulation factor subunit 2 n=1 Tax=Armadillidium nasatum TaxID=96803 RepID=A0A5N5SNB8_9CRUS|nr:Cleavage stimulation factor subunit 2 [Armadillidium nasatum]